MSPRAGYTNVGPSQERARWLEVICRHLVLDPEAHWGRLGAIDFALRRTGRDLMPPQCESCGKLLPLSSSPYQVDEGESCYLCDECAGGEE